MGFSYFLSFKFFSPHPQNRGSQLQNSQGTDVPDGLEEPTSVKIPNVPRYWWPQPPWWQLTEVGDPESVDWSLIIQSLSRV